MLDWTQFKALKKHEATYTYTVSIIFYRATTQSRTSGVKKTCQKTRLLDGATACMYPEKIQVGAFSEHV
jgi:hypothetical protein